MVAQNQIRSIQVQGVDLAGNETSSPIVLQMHDDDFPVRFLQDLASPNAPQISSATKVNLSSQSPMPVLYQPVQRMLTLAMVDLECNTPGNPQLCLKRVQSAGLVIRRAYRTTGAQPGTYIDNPNMLSAWVQDAQGKFSWQLLTSDQEDLDPDPTQRPQLQSGQPDVDSQLLAMYLSSPQGYTESTTAAYAAPPATCAALGRTVYYAVIPTASSQVSDTPPAQPPNFDPTSLINSLPALLSAQLGPSTQWQPTPTPPPTVDYRWLSDEFLNAVYPPTQSSDTPPLPIPNPAVAQFQQFTLALRMLHTVFGAFDGSTLGNAILNVLNKRNVYFQNPATTQKMGDFFLGAKQALIDYGINNSVYPSPAPPASSSPAPPTVPMPDSWDTLTTSDQSALVNAMIAALAPRSQNLNLLAPQGRFQDETRLYKLRMFFRIKSNTPGCPPKLVWSQYSGPFQIAPWHASGQRPHPPIPLPDPTSAFLKNAQPNCSFQVPASLMNAMQGSTLSGLMNGAGGGGAGVGLGWICGFNIPLITICAFFVLNIFLSLLNIVFFWLPFIKICIPIPVPSPANPDKGTP